MRDALVVIVAAFALRPPSQAKGFGLPRKMRSSSSFVHRPVASVSAGGGSRACTISPMATPRPCLVSSGPGCRPTRRRTAPRSPARGPWSVALWAEALAAVLEAAMAASMRRCAELAEISVGSSQPRAHRTSSPRQRRSSEPLQVAEPSPNHPRDAPVPDASDDAAIIAEITAFEEAKAHRRSPAFLREQINSILQFYAPVVERPARRLPQPAARRRRGLRSEHQARHRHLPRCHRELRARRARWTCVGDEPLTTRCGHSP